MNHRITLLQPEAGKDAYGQPLSGWTPLSPIWADVQFESGKEVLRAGAEVSVLRASVRIRARKDVTAGWRIRYNGRDFDIKGPPRPDRDPFYMFLVCEAAR